MVFILSAAPSVAAEIALVRAEIDDRSQPTYYRDVVGFRLTGEIVPGDAEALSDALYELIPTYELSALRSVTVSLDSPGGSFAEGLELMSPFYDLAIGTVVEGDAACLSACAIAFFGGRAINEASFGYTSRTVNPGGRLGFHAPSLGFTGDTEVPAAQLDEAYAAALKSIAEVTDRAAKFDIRNALLDTIISTPPDEMYVVDLVDDFVRWNIEVPIDEAGWIPDRLALARLCPNIPTWETGASAVARDAVYFETAGADSS